MKIHLDTDLGGDIDDICALAMLLKWPDVQITGITTNTENEGRRAGYTKYVLKIAGREDIAVKSGAEVSAGFYRGKPGLPKESDYWPEPIMPSPNSIDEALDLLKSSIEQESTIVGIGAFTNLYLLDQKYPGILKKAKLYLMGGSIYPVKEGYLQWGNNMDWNIQADIKSAKYVLEESEPTLVTLSVSLETYLRRAYLEPLRQSGPLGELIARQAEVFARDWKNEENYGKKNKNIPDDTINFQYDPLACAIAFGWCEGVEIKEVPLRFDVKDTYLCEVIDDSGKSTRVVTKADGDKFSEFWLKVVTQK
jgi:purine nucleosidase